MLNKIINYALHHRLVILLLTAVVTAVGLWTARQMEVDVFPDLTAPTVVVMTEAGGMAPEEVERSVTFPIESAVNGAADVRRVRSSSQVGLSTVWVEFDWGMDPLRTRQIVSEKLQSIAEQMPQGVSAPMLAPQSSLLGEIYAFTVTADSTTSAMDLRTLVEWSIRPRLLALGGVAQISYLGGEEREYFVKPNPDKMKHFGVTLDEVIKTVDGNNINASGGVLNEYGNEYVVRGMGRSSSIEELGALLVKRGEGDAAVRLRNVADIEIGAAQKIGEGAYRGAPAVVATVTKQPNVNTLELTRKIDATLQDIQITLPPDVKIHTDIFNQGEFIEVAVNNVGRALLEGSIFVIIILFVFLWNGRTTLISLTAIPLSLLTTILILKALNITINTMTLGGMAIAIGSLVDDAIIDVENVYKRLKENARYPEGERQPVLQVIFDASVEIRASILNATLIILVSFVPLFFLSGMEGRMLKPLGIAYIVSLLASLVVALTLTPVLCYFLLRSKKVLSAATHERGASAWLRPRYERSLAAAMHHKKAILYGSLALFAGALIVFSTFGRGFLPPFNEGQITVLAMGTPGISLDESDKLGSQVERVLLKMPEVKTTARRTGRAEMAEHSLGTAVSEIDVPFTLPRGESKDRFLEKVRERLADIPGMVTEISQPVSHRIDAMLSGTGANIAVKLFGDDLHQLFESGNAIKAEIADVPGIADLNVEQQIEVPQLQIIPNKELLTHYGMTLAEFNEVVRYGIGGQQVGEIFEQGRSVPVVVRFDESNRGSIESIRNIFVDGADGAKVPLGLVAEVKSSAGANAISRENAQRKLVISVNVVGRDVGSVVDDISKRVDQFIALPEGFHIEYGGSFESQKTATRTLAFASFIALLLIFLLLYQEFKDVRLSGLILLNLPLALIGGIAAVWLSSGVISIPAVIGFITLLGIATRNGILLVSHYEHLRREGRSLDEAVLAGSADRLAPILMTALTAALALIPLALQSSRAGNEIQSPMAVVILGGLLSSTFLNIYLVPIVYKIMKDREETRKNLV
ncbi:MAG: CusA/CzcA family heavy metal efflux RND transporter [Rikenellaceae bacterium]|jgi:CzcA family heavy metal efflux pump|nr:CusA/CzcA family heavy metal efflux RND transporter [Rikenellaceae bacterium]